MTAKGELSHSGSRWPPSGCTCGGRRAAAALLGASFLLHHDYLALRMWTGLTLFAGLAPPVIAAWSGLAHRLSGRRAAPSRPAPFVAGRG